MHRREYKRKAQDILLEDASNVISNMEEWKEEWPFLLEKLKSLRIELRISALKSMNKILASQFVGSEIMPFLNDTVLSLIPYIKKFSTIKEHNKALKTICLLSLSTFDEFQKYALSILNELMPSISEITPDQKKQYSTVAFIITFSVDNEVTCLNVVNKFIDFILTRNVRSNLKSASVSMIIDAISLILCSFQEVVIAKELLNKLISLIDIGISSKSIEVVCSTITLISIIYEALDSIHHTPDDDDNSILISKNFLFKYRSKIFSLPYSFNNKKDRKVINKIACKTVFEIEEGKETVLAINYPPIHINGLRNNLILNSIKTKVFPYLNEQMKKNVNIQQMFGYSLLSDKQTHKVISKMKADISNERALNKKEREALVKKNRYQKDLRGLGDDEFFDMAAGKPDFIFL